MIGIWLLQNVWLVTILWALVYISDYYLTIYSARQFAGPMRRHIQVEGSFELTPVFQKDVDALKMFSPAFFSRLLISLALIPAIYVVALNLFENLFLYEFLIGGLFLRSASIHLRHLRNVTTAILVRRPGSMRGKVENSRWLTLRLSGAELMGFGVLFLLAALVASSAFFLGGGVITSITGIQHWAMARKMQPALPAAAEQ